MKFFSAKLLLIPFLVLNATSASATLYTISFGTSDNNIFNPAGTPARGTLEGFIVIDDTLTDSNYSNNSSDDFISIPSWLTQASFTFTNTDGNTDIAPTITRTLTSPGSQSLQFVSWRIKDGVTFDPSAADFAGQMDRFAFMNLEGTFAGAIPAGSGAGMQVHDEEFTLARNQAAVPGPLPILGLAPLAWYFRKLKRKSIKL